MVQLARETIGGASAISCEAEATGINNFSNCKKVNLVEERYQVFLQNLSLERARVGALLALVLGNGLRVVPCV